MVQQSSNGNRPKLSEKGLLTPDNCVVALIDHQGQMLFGTSNLNPRRRHGSITCSARTMTGVFPLIRLSGRSFGTPSNIFVCGPGGMTGSYLWAAKLARFGNRSETTTGANSRS